MKFRLFAGCAALGLTGTLAATLAGCGGGGSAVTAPGVTTRAALTGVAQAPQSQTRGVSRDGTTATDPLVAVSGATVTLSNLDDTTVANGVVGTTTTGADGSYSFPTVTPGTNYKVEAVKTIGTKTLRLDAVVTAPTPTGSGASPAPVAHDLTPNSTVAAVAIIAQAAALKAADPTSTHTNLQALADDLVKKRVADNTPPPDCANPAAVSSDASALTQATAPKGSYTGLAVTTAVSAGSANQKVGDTTRLAAQIDASGHFFLVALGHNDKTTAAAATGTAASGSGSSGDFAAGRVTSSGIVNATTKDGSIKVVGIFTSGTATGTFKSVDGTQSGTWTLTPLKTTYAGLYAGKYVTLNPGGATGDGTGSGNGSGNGNGSGSGTGTGSGSGSGGSGGLNLGISSNGVKGDFALLVLDDNSALILGAGSSGSVYGTGAVGASGALTFTVKDSSGTTATGTGQIDATAHTVTGTFSTSSVETGQFEGRSDHADTSDL